MNSVSIHRGGPLYAQVREILTQRITEGEWQPGDLLPSEQQLARQLNVSQGTVRKAMNDLVAINVLVRQQGKGTFVASHDAQRVLFHFFHIAANDGSKVLPTSSVLSWSRRRASKREAQALKLPAGARVIQIERIRDLGGKPTIVETIVVPTALFPDLVQPDEHLPNTLYQLYQHRYGVTIHRAEEKLRAVAAGEREAQLLNVEVGTPLLEIERLALTLPGNPVELRISRCDTREHYYDSTLA
ncbi:MAG: GntR family transcriptional regulator [Chromatiaceae bacterium]|nr:GntR family transcriptional regulator [Chromatiaceae bacterium]